MTVVEGVDGWVSSRNASWEEATLAVVPVKIKSRIPEESFSSVLHAHAVGVLCRSATSGYVKERIPDIHFM